MTMSCSVDIVQEILDDCPPNIPYDNNQPRQRLRSWLTEQLDTDNCPGCSWISKDMKIFKLTWKHYGRPGFDEERDAKIFREWARHTKRYSPGDPSDVSTWKTRFRNALHKMPDIEEMTSHHQLEGNDPYRVYRFRTPEEMERIREVQKTTYAMINSPMMPPSYSSAPSPYSTAPSPYSTSVPSPYSTTSDSVRSPYPPREIEAIKNYLMHQTKDVHENNMPTNNANNNGNNMVNTFNTFDGLELEDIEKILMKETSMVPNGNGNGNGHLEHHLPQPANVVKCHALPNIRLNSIPVTAVGVKLYFSEKDVKSQIVNNQHGVRIAYQPPPPVSLDIVQGDGAKAVLSNIYGPLEAEQIYYPHAEDANSQKMLNWIQRGLVVEVKENGDIYATRLCQAKVFYADNVLVEPNELVRSQQTMVFSFQNEFLPMLQAYKRGQACAPSWERYFSFGQKWSRHEPLKEVLVHCSVTHFLSKKLFKEIKAQKPIEQFVSAQNYDDMLKERMEKIVLADSQH